MVGVRRGKGETTANQKRENFFIPECLNSFSFSHVHVPLPPYCNVISKNPLKLCSSPFFKDWRNSVNSAKLCQNFWLFDHLGFVLESFFFQWNHGLASSLRTLRLQLSLCFLTPLRQMSCITCATMALFLDCLLNHTGWSLSLRRPAQ